MAVWTKLIVLAVPLLLIALTAVAGYAYTQIRFLSLPIPQALALFTVVLPLITGIATHGTISTLTRLTKSEQSTITLPLIAIIGFQLMYETIVATLAISHMIPPANLRCGLDSKWMELFRSKDATAIKAIQDSFNCCGLNSVRDRAWPFPGVVDGRTRPSICPEVNGRTNSCFGAWRQAEQINAGLLLLVAVAVFIVKVLSLVSLLTTSNWTQPRWARAFGQVTNGNVEDNRASMRRLIEEGDAGSYRDEPSEGVNEAPEPAASSPDHGPRTVPSPLNDHSNAWQT